MLCLRDKHDLKNIQIQNYRILFVIYIYPILTFAIFVLLHHDYDYDYGCVYYLSQAVLIRELETPKKFID